ncbi:hypothetical protein HDA32_001331 [Spinactinospora alkalitolerans]|uniref:DUF222 domain-containing protein n=1 Tax=Spinactinospora alkalitolerans TaxID=687207 RepID=A0A852TRM7_9ACTN|nr:hypothetical protein [Spinactinospora alkalitolerans]NYE46211.1 hypothetical protein [Spinactinospora alkalitolerans]
MDAAPVSMVAAWVGEVGQDSLSGSELLDFAAACERARRESESRQLTAIARSAAEARCREHGSYGHAEECAAAEIATELELPPGYAAGRTGHASRITACFPGVHASLLKGEIDSDAAEKRPHGERLEF